MTVDGGADILGDLALQQVRRADGELHDFQTAGHLAHGIVVGPAVLGRDGLGQLVGPVPEDYLAHAGQPLSLDHLGSHTLIGYVDDLIYTPELNDSQDFARDWKSDVEVFIATGQFEAVRAGAAIGICHDFMAAGVPGFVRLFPDMSVSRRYWLVWHET